MIKEFRPITWVMLLVLMAMIVVPAYFLFKLPEEPIERIDPMAPPDIPTAKPRPNDKPAANNPAPVESDEGREETDGDGDEKNRATE